MTVEELVKIIHCKETFFDCQINVAKIGQDFEEMNSQILANQKFFFRVLEMRTAWLIVAT